MEKNKIMKKLLLIFLCLPIISLAQQTYVPDDNFEAYLEAKQIKTKYMLFDIDDDSDSDSENSDEFNEFED